MQAYEKSGCFTPNKEHVVNISTDKQYLNSHHRVQTVSSIMFKDLGSREHSGVTQLEMWRYLTIWAGSHCSWDNRNSVLVQAFSTSHKWYAVQARTNCQSHLPSHHYPLSLPPLWHNWTSLRAFHCSPSSSCPQVTNWWQAVCDTGQHPRHTSDVLAGGTAKGHFLVPT